MLDMHEVGGSSPLVSTSPKGRAVEYQESRYKVISLSLDEVFGFDCFTFSGRQCLHPIIDCVQCVFEFYITMARFHHKRGISAVGSAQHWQCWGQGFKSPMLHQNPECESVRGFSFLPLHHSLFPRPRIRNFGQVIAKCEKGCEKK